MLNLIIFVLIALSQFVVNKANQNYEQKIVHGFKARPTQFPFIAFLEIKSMHGQGMVCGGSLISDRWVLTAAHCIDTAKNVNVYLGMTDIANPLEPGRVKIPVSRFHIYLHPNYLSLLAWNDIALIRLPKKVQLSKYIQPVPLPKSCDSPGIVNTIAVGHGITGDNDSVSTDLLWAELKTISMTACRNEYPTMFWRNSVICAVNDILKQSVCSGDSGGPLVTRINPTLIGVTCFVRADGCEKGTPQGFTMVRAYMSWIKSITRLDIPKC